MLNLNIICKVKSTVNKIVIVIIITFSDILTIYSFKIN